MKNWWLSISIFSLLFSCTPRNKGATEQGAPAEQKTEQKVADSSMNVIRHGAANQQQLDSLKKAKLKAKGIR